MAVRLLTETGVERDVQCDSSNAALHVSAMKGFLNISKLLIESGCDINLQNSTSSGSSKWTQSLSGIFAGKQC